MFEQTLKILGYFFRDTTGFDMSYNEIQQLCREAWETQE